jgi:hypothetical protein
MQFPPVTAHSLAGRRVMLPTDLAGEERILLLVFQRWQQDLISSWIPFLEQLEQAHPAVRAYQVPVLRELASVVQAFIDEGMQAGIADPAARERTLTVYVDKAAFRNALGLPDEDTIYVLLVDRRGEVRWRARGGYTPEQGEALARAVEKNGRGRPGGGALPRVERSGTGSFIEKGDSR